MKQYKLLKDLPELKAGSTFVEVGKGDMENLKLIYQIDDDGVPRCAYTWIDPEKPNEWFEEIRESTDSIHWNPMIGEKCFILENANIIPTLFTGKLRDYNAWRIGKIFRTEEECEKARDRELAEARLRRTSTFEPDFKDDKAGWAIYYNHRRQELWCDETLWYDAGEPVRYETEEEAEKSIKENERDWLIYFGIEEKE